VEEERRNFYFSMTAIHKALTEMPAMMYDYYSPYMCIMAGNLLDDANKRIWIRAVYNAIDYKLSVDSHLEIYFSDTSEKIERRIVIIRDLLQRIENLFQQRNQEVQLKTTKLARFKQMLNNYLNKTMTFWTTYD